MDKNVIDNKRRNFNVWDLITFKKKKKNKMYPVNRTVWFLKSHVNPFLRTHYIFN